MSEFYTNVFNRGNKMFVRGYRDGFKFKDIISFEPTLYVGKSNDYESELTAYITNQKVEPIQFEDVRAARDFVKQYEDVSNFKIYGNTNYVHQYIGFKWTQEIAYDPTKIDTMFIDIETETECGFPDHRTANEKIQLITVKRKGKKAITFAYKPVDGAPLNTEYRLSIDEEHMLRAFVAYISGNYPDVISGWNVDGFDIPYLCIRINNILGEDFLKKLSPFGFVNSEEVDNMGRKEFRFDLCGIAVLDYFPMYKKFVLEPRESYKLDFIAEVEVGEKKLDHSEFENFKSFYDGDWRKFVEYNIIDVELVEKIDNKRMLLDLVYSVAYMAKINFTDVYSPIKTWEAVIYNYLLEHKQVVPMKKHTQGAAFEGAYVKDTLVGAYSWVVTLDLTSLYPHLIMLCNMSPETLTGQSIPCDMDKLINKNQDLSEAFKQNCSVAGNGQLFKNDTHGVFPILMHTLFNTRKKYKDEMITLKKSGGNKHMISMLNTKQNAIKVLLNSLYGAAGNAYFRYYDLRIAEGITKTGQLAIRWIERKINEKFNSILNTNNIDYVIASDTDSVMVNFGPIVKELYDGQDTVKTIQYLDKICNEVIQPYIQKCYVEMAEYINAYEPALHMKRENLCVHPDTIILVNNKHISIKDYYNSIDELCEDNVKVSYDLTESFNIQLNSYEIDHIDFVSRKSNSERMFEIELENGTIMRLTENHEVLVDRNSKFVWIKTKDLSENDEIIYHSF